jgi:hypothetical protein
MNSSEDFDLSINSVHFSEEERERMAKTMTQKEIDEEEARRNLDVQKKQIADEARAVGGIDIEIEGLDQAA